VHVDLCSRQLVFNGSDDSIYVEPWGTDNANPHTMLGTKVFQAEMLIDDQGNDGVFFLIDKISIRRLGFYKLRFSLNQLLGYFNDLLQTC
jgi:hypothetical protein